MLTLFALAVGQLRGAIDADTVREVATALRAMPEIIERHSCDPEVQTLSRIFTYAHNFLYLGRGYNYPTALEGALAQGNLLISTPRGCPQPR